jgi:GT2 family glycosyltransferase
MPISKARRIRDLGSGSNQFHRMASINPRALLAYGAHTTSWPDGRRLAHDQTGFPEGWCADAFLDRNWIHSPGQTLIRRDALERLGGFDQDLAGSDDWDLYLRLARLGPFVRVPGEALIYREHGANASRDAVAHARDHLRVMNKHMRGHPLLVLRHLRLAAAYFVPNLDRLAAVCRGEGRYAEALRANLYALLFRPTLLARPRFLASCAASLLGVPSRRRTT